jgi:Sulfotransferase domain
MLPNFLIIGAAKGGTNALHSYLREHPDIFMPETKELKFFSHEEVWSQGVQWYSSLFPEGYKLYGEGSVQYTMFPNFPDPPKRIASTLPDVRMIFLVRDPIERMQSQYRHLFALGLEHDPVEDAFLRDWPSLEIYRRPEERSLYIHYSMYAMQLERYLEIFPPDRLLVLTSEELHVAETRPAAMGKILGFLGLDPSWTAPVVEQEFHKAEERRTLRSPKLHEKISRAPGYKRLTGVVPQRVKVALAPLIVKGIDPGPQVAEVTETFRKELESILAPDVARLRGHLDPDFDGWGIA